MKEEDIFDSLFWDVREEIPYLKRKDFDKVLLFLSLDKLESYFNYKKQMQNKKSDAWFVEIINFISQAVNLELFSDKKIASSSKKNNDNQSGVRRIHTIYDIASPDIFGITMEKHQYIIDQLFLKLPLVEQEILNGYLRHEYNSTTVRGKRALRIIVKLQYQYQSYYNLKKNKFTSLYQISYPEEFGIPKKEYPHVIDTLFHSLDDRKQDILNHYFNGDYDRDSGMQIEAKEIISGLRIQLDKISDNYEYLNQEEKGAISSENINTRYSGFIMEVVEVIKNSCHVSLVNDLSLEMQRSFFHAFELIEYHYRSNGKSLKEYRQYCEELLVQIFTMNPHMNLEELIKQFIFIAFQDYLSEDQTFLFPKQ